MPCLCGLIYALFKECTSYFLLVKLRAFCVELAGLLFPTVAVTIYETLDVIGLFLKMFLLFRSYHICYWFLCTISLFDLDCSEAQQDVITGIASV